METQVNGSLVSTLVMSAALTSPSKLSSSFMVPPQAMAVETRARAANRRKIFFMALCSGGVGCPPHEHDVCQATEARFPEGKRDSDAPHCSMRAPVGVRADTPPVDGCY